MFEGQGAMRSLGLYPTNYMANLTLGPTLYVDLTTATVAFLCLLYAKILDKMCCPEL